MKTIATLTLLLGTIAVGIAPAAEAHDDHRNRYARHDHHDMRHTRNDMRHTRHDMRELERRHGDHWIYAKQVRQVRKLATRLERATDELRLDARHAAGRIDRQEARALTAIRQLERSADRFRRHTTREDAFPRYVLRRELRDVKERFRVARSSARALRPSRELDRDFERVQRLLNKLSDDLAPPRAVASRRGHRGYRIAQR